MVEEVKRTMKHEDGHTEHTDDCMSEWGERRRFLLPLTKQTIEMNHRLHMADVECDRWKDLDNRFGTDPSSPLHHDNRCPHH